MKAYAILGALGCLAAGTVAAQSSVQVFGTLDAYAGTLKLSGESARRNAVNSGGMTTSNFGFRATEDLGGGTKVEFLLAGFFLVDTGASGRTAADNMFSRNALVSLSGDFGTVAFGRTNAPSFLPAVQYNPFADSMPFSPLMVHTFIGVGPAGARRWAPSTAGDSGWSNQVIYTTPKIGDLHFNFYYQPGEVANDSSAKNYAVNAYYSRGGLGLTAAYHNVRVSNPNPGRPIIDATAAPINYGSITHQKGYYVGARYDFKVLKLFGTYRENHDDASLGKEMEDHVTSAGISVPAGKGAFLLAAATTKRSGSLVGTSMDRRTISAGYDYAMSKRTDLYALYMHDDISIYDSAGSFAAGIRHRY